jgi:hypothetical protein
VLLHFDGADASTTFTDESGKVWTAAGNAQLDTTILVFGTAAGLFDGTGDYISTIDHADFATGTGDYTIDFWFKTTDTDGWLFYQGDNSGIAGSIAHIIGVGLVTSGKLGWSPNYRNYPSQTTLQSISTVTDGGWHHCACVRNGDVFTLYLDGVSQANTTLAAYNALDSTESVFIGQMNTAAGHPYNGSMDEFRFSKGIARWTSAFTVPSVAYGPSVDPVLNASLVIPLDIRTTIMRGLAGDIYDSKLSIPLSISGTMDFEPISVLESNLAIQLVMSGTINAPVWYECWGASIEFPVFTVSATGIFDCFGNASINLPFFTFEASGINDALGNASFELPVISVSATGQTDIIGTASFSLPRLTIDASTLISSIGDASITFPLLSVYGVGQDGAVGTFNKSLPMFKLSAGTFNEILGDGDIVLPMFTLITSVLPTTAYLSMVMNLKNRALTLYDNYDFNSLCRFKDKHFGATKTGIYDLDTGTTDNGTLIDWNFRTGYLDLEQKNKKKLKQAWLSYKSDGDLILTVIQPNGDEYEYSLQGIDSTENGLRVKFGKGIRSKYVALDIKNVDGSTITLDTLKLHLDKLSLNR